jgi:hypothetical protein
MGLLTAGKGVGGLGSQKEGFWNGAEWRLCGLYGHSISSCECPLLTKRTRFLRQDTARTSDHASRWRRGVCHGMAGEEVRRQTS